jgi:hypothetical protein
VTKKKENPHRTKIIGVLKNPIKVTKAEKEGGRILIAKSNFAC